MISPLTTDELNAALGELHRWSHDAERRALYREIRVGDFAEAMGLMIRIGIEADKMDHHPEWANVYNRIEIWLTTHDAGNVSVRDVALARRIDAVFPG
ncbi:4a-hydroxytetrahydrobiopterin dehydratase [Sphingobium sp. AP50]|uniref:4a-hydroxytetrahydrobiopterin dehydratase n=1 Tax=Sphingobium sp. AP50 TaxID=1884369 RepID=UPI0008D2C5C6|nr:4a-hydroxytetrahydrobiopterin dehydratase [Sphingobium sp. AP50]SEJ72411.1 4a-hydroxytetrahydrobiopterin dehydratase [Sphingobium sp. AP50]